MIILDFILEVIGALIFGLIAIAAVMASISTGDAEIVDTDNPHHAPLANPTLDYRITEVSEVKAGDEVFHPRHYDSESGAHRFL